MGETQERSVCWAHFSQRYFQCNPGALSEGEEARVRVFLSGHGGRWVLHLCKASMSVCAEVHECTSLQHGSMHVLQTMLA